MNELYMAGLIFVLMIVVLMFLEMRRNKYWRDFERRMRNKPKECECHRCIAEFKIGSESPLGWIPLSYTKMILCPKCGCKRCPKASDHDLACTDSNAPGQPGSVYK